MQRRELFQRRFWRDFLVDLKRSSKDARARRSILARLALIGYFIGFVAYEGFLLRDLHDVPTEIGVGIVLVIFFAIIAGAQFSQWRESRNQLKADIASVSPEITATVQRLAHGLAAVTQRALGERWLANNTVPENHTIVVRRIQLDTLRSRDVWDELPTEVRTWMMSPDGSWPQDRVAHVVTCGETLNTLLWALALQSTLRPVEDLLTSLSMSRLAKALEKPAPGIRPTWDLRVERNRAHEYFWRCQSERVHRGLAEADSEDQAAAMHNWMDEITESPHTDYLAGASTIRELDNHALDAATHNSAHRFITLGHLMDLLDGVDAVPALTHHVYVSLVTAHTSEQEPQESSAVQT